MIPIGNNAPTRFLEGVTDPLQRIHERQIWEWCPWSDSPTPQKCLHWFALHRQSGSSWWRSPWQLPDKERLENISDSRDTTTGIAIHQSNLVHLAWSCGHRHDKLEFPADLAPFALFFAPPLFCSSFFTCSPVLLFWSICSFSLMDFSWLARCSLASRNGANFLNWASCKSNCFEPDRSDFLADWSVSRHDLEFFLAFWICPSASCLSLWWPFHCLSEVFLTLLDELWALFGRLAKKNLKTSDHQTGSSHRGKFSRKDLFWN